ncbi:leucine efflux protein LeuE [Hydrogenophaga sp.]|uniref:leucine efflux protein LeuE n=1 Tax=Hydrogenophaga sp. TaxID=1904254 RepID=UPI0026187D99|nr:leucine efflux protein LeuE [Hydrogenophaga sp.]MDM7949703.1 leucine efflux protein LeuE [Hydrogenophaga sp.]
MSFYGVTDIWTYALGALGIVLLPGPNSMFVLAVASARGVTAGYQAATGVFVGDAVLLLLTALGAATLLHTYPALFVVVKYAGAAYLAWLGVGLIRSTLRQGLAPVAACAESVSTRPDAPAAHPFRRALLISLLNPKAILFLLSFFVQFIDPAYPVPAVPFLILSAIVMLFSALYLSALIVGGAHLAQVFRARRRLSAGLASGVGVLFVGFGAKLATASL